MERSPLSVEESPYDGDILLRGACTPAAAFSKACGLYIVARAPRECG